MGKFDMSDNYSQSKGRDNTLHPAWRGIGCALLVIIPVMAFAGSTLLLEANAGSKWLRGLPAFFYGPSSNPWLYGKLAFAALISFFGFGLLFIIYAIIYRFVGPPQYGPTDAPPPRKRPQQRRR